MMSYAYWDKRYFYGVNHLFICNNLLENNVLIVCDIVMLKNIFF